MSAPSSLDGMWLGRRHILRRIGVGGMGDVYLAEEPYLNRQVAIKVIRGEAMPGQSIADVDDAQRRFAQEARAVAALDHPNILPLYDYGEQNGLHYLVMPYVQDGSLADLMTRDPQRRFTPPLAPLLAAQIVSQTAAALQYAHDRGIVHRDVKPHNLLVRLPSSTSAPLPSATSPSSAIHILLADFGVARFMEELSSQTGATGTPLYSPPEQFAGRPVYASDQYALACVAYLLLTGQPVFRGSIVELYHQHLSVAPTPPSQVNPALPAGVDDALLRALAKQPQDRYPRVEQFAQAIAVAMQSAASDARLPTPTHGGFDGAQTTSAQSPTAPPIPANAPLAGAPPITPILPQVPADRSTGLLADAQRPPDGMRQPSLTDIDPDRVLSEPYTVPDTEHELAAGAGHGAAYGPPPPTPTLVRPAASMDEAVAHPLPTKPQRGSRRAPQRALLLALAVVVALAALAGVGAANGGFAALRGLGAASSGKTATAIITATATATQAPTLTPTPSYYTPSGFQRFADTTFSIAYPPLFNPVTVPNLNPGNAEYVDFQDSAYDGYPALQVIQSRELAASNNVEGLFHSFNDNPNPLGQETSIPVGGVTWLQRSGQIDTPPGVVIQVYIVCIHDNIAYMIDFISLQVNYASDYANYYHPMLLSFAFTQ